MRLVLELTATDPPVGAVTDENGRGHPFDGWLGLLGVLADLLEQPPPDGQAG